MANSSKLPTMDMSYNSGRGYDPVHELMRAIILRTIDDFNSTGEFHQVAVDYLHEEEQDHIFSFQFICKQLNLDPGKTRSAIMNATHKISTRRRAA